MASVTFEFTNYVSLSIDTSDADPPEFSNLRDMNDFPDIFVTP